MGNQPPLQAVVSSQKKVDSNRIAPEIALFQSDGTPFVPVGATVTTGTAVGTAAKTTTSDEPSANTIVPVKFTNGNSAATPTLAFNGGTARAMKLAGTASPAAKLAVAAGGIAFFMFDGTDLHQLGAYT